MEPNAYRYWYRNVYLYSEHWRDLAREVKAAAKYKCADCCERKPLQCHHLTYALVGHEAPGDVIPLCDNCHGMRHGLHFEDELEKNLRDPI
jgi:hypothetical protein